MCKQSGCYNPGHAKYGGYCRKHAPTVTPTVVVPPKPKTVSRPVKETDPDDNSGSKALSRSSGKGPDKRWRPFIHRWGCEYLILTADGRLPTGSVMPKLMFALVEAMPVSTHAGRASKDRVGAALECFAGELEQIGLVLFPVPKTLYELLIATMPCTQSATSVKLDGFVVDDVFDLDCGKAGPAKLAPVTCAAQDVRAWMSTSHKDTAKAKEIATVYAELRSARAHLEFRLLANAWVARELLAQPLCEGVIIHRFVAAALAALGRTDQRALSPLWASAFTSLSGKGKRTEIPQMLLATMLVEYAQCPEGEPGFLIYRGTGKYSEDSSLAGGFDLSYAMSLFGGWFFDGPSNVTASACTIQYLMTARGEGQDYWIVRIKWSEYLDPRGSCSILQHLLLPALPVSLQLFGTGGGFHARMWKRDAISSSVILAFMKAHHLSFLGDRLGTGLLETACGVLLPGTPPTVDLASLAAAKLVDLIEQLDDAARLRGWVRHPVPGGGDCLYHAVLTHFSLEELGVEQDDQESEVAALRRALAKFFDQNADALDGPLRDARIDTAGLRQPLNDHHEGADLVPYLIQRYIDAKGLAYNLRIYRFLNGLQTMDLGRATDPELPIAQWQNYYGGHFDPMLPVLERMT